MKQSQEQEKNAALGKLSWNGEYWGREGALALGHGKNDAILRDSHANNEELAHAHMELASLDYSASGAAWAASSEVADRFMRLLWGLRVVYYLWSARNHSVHAKRLVGFTLMSLSDLDVFQTIARRYCDLLGHLPQTSRRRKEILREAKTAVSKAFAREGGCDGILGCLTRCGSADLYLRECLPNEAIHELEIVWEQAESIRGKNLNQETRSQLSRVYRNLLVVALKLPGEVRQTGGPIINRILLGAERIGALLADGSRDQQDKMRAAVRARTSV